MFPPPAPWSVIPLRRWFVGVSFNSLGRLVRRHCGRLRLFERTRRALTAGLHGRVLPTGFSPFSRPRYRVFASNLLCLSGRRKTRFNKNDQDTARAVGLYAYNRSEKKKKYRIVQFIGPATTETYAVPGALTNRPNKYFQPYPFTCDGYVGLGNAIDNLARIVYTRTARMIFVPSLRNRVGSDYFFFFFTSRNIL